MRAAARRTACLGLLAFACLSAPHARARPIKVSTWNLDWLTTRPTGDPALPDTVRTRAPSDWAVLAGEAARLSPDIVAVEEVDGPGAAARLFPPDRYTILMTGDDVVQRVGLAVRHPLVVRQNPDVAALDVTPRARHRLRSGLDATVTSGGTALRILAVHLKTGCWSGDEDREARRACPVFDRQVPVIAAWIQARAAEGVPFLVLGDFNRRLAIPGDRVMAALAASGPVVDPEAGQSSPCWGGEDLIDHILLGGPARPWLEASSLRVMVYRDRDAADKDRLSDHCPVSVRLDVP